MQPSFDPTVLEQNLNLRDYFNILNKRRMTVLTVFVIVFVISLILGLSKVTPLYTSFSTILMERNFGPRDAGLGMYYWDPEFLPTQKEIIKSKRVALRVVDNLQLGEKYYNHFLGPKKENESFISSTKKSAKSFITQLFKDEVIEETDVQKPLSQDPEKTRNIIADILKSGIEVEPVEGTRIVNIHYTDTDPQLAKIINDAVVQAYIDENLEMQLTSSRQSLHWMTNKTEEERKKLEKAELNLQKYLREHNLVTLENRLAIYPEKLSKFSTELSIAEAKRKDLQYLRKKITDYKNSPQQLETIPLFAENENLQSLRNQILSADQKIKELSKKYGSKHPAMIKAVDDHEILIKEKNIEIKRIYDSLQNEYELARSNEINLKELLGSTKRELLNVNERFIQYSIMKREVESSRALYEALTSSLKKASVTEESQNVNIWIMREASLPQAPSNQKPKRNMLLGFFLAISAGIGMAFFLEYLDNTLKSSDDVENRYGLTVLGTVLETRKNEQIEKIISEDAQSAIAEGFRMIRSSLLLSSADHPPRTILITSMKAQEGKTSIALNLARTMAQVADKILIIDADMRKPRMHSLLGVQNTTGLSSFLSGNIDEKIVHSGKDNNISVIPSGPIPPNPVELISSQRMKTLLQEMSGIYDYIIIDSPPIIHLADGLILSTLVDGTVLVTRAGKTTFDIFNAGLKKLNDFKPHILGVILNAMSSRVSGPQSYYHYYEYYSEDKSKPEKR